MKNVTRLFVIILVIAVGCDSADEQLVNRLADTSQEVVRQQQEIARTQHEIAEGSKHLVEAVAQSRQEHNEMQKDLQNRRDELERERKAIVAERRMESLLGPLISTTGGLLVAALPLLLCWCLLHGLRSQEEEVSEVFIEQLVMRTPQLLGPASDNQPAIEDQRASTQVDDPPF